MDADTMASPRPAKRQRTSGFSSKDRSADTLTPPLCDQDLPVSRSAEILARAAHVLATEAQALANISRLYQTDSGAKESLLAAVDAILTCQNAGGKLIVCGVGKSAYIGQKFVATCKSLGVGASFMHACEAVHGDLGDIRKDDIILFISFSGKTPELINILPHIPASTRLMAMTSQSDAKICALLADRDDGILLPTPIPEGESSTFGVSAPTTSTTVTLAVADMVALTVAEELCNSRRTTTREVFKRNHPGGAIGMSHRAVEEVRKASASGESKVKIEILELPSPSISAESDDG